MQEYSRGEEYIVMVLSLLIAMLLTVLPLPTWANWARPQWVFIVLLFWVIVKPSRVGVGSAFTVGVLMDLLTGTFLGQHALAYSIVSYILIKFHPQLRAFPMWQQMLMLGGVVLLNLILQYLTLDFLGVHPATFAYWLPVLSSTLLWPWVSMLLREAQPSIALG